MANARAEVQTKVLWGFREVRQRAYLRWPTPLRVADTQNPDWPRTHSLGAVYAGAWITK